MSDTNRLPGLDLLRAVAIVWVMLFHSYLVGGLGRDFEWLPRFGWAGVDLFFVLSGFLIGTEVLRPLARGARLSLRGFYRRRAWRILPAFLVVLALYALFPSLRESPGLQPWWQFATFSMNLLIDYTRNQAFSHAWSLCVEEHFYLVFPLLAVWLAGRSSARTFVGACLVVVAVGVALRGVVWWHDAAIDPPRNWFVEDLYYPTWMRLDGLLVGVMLAALRVYRPSTWSRLQARSNATWIAGATVSGVALWLFADRVGLLANTIGWPALSIGFGLLVLAGADARGPMGRWRPALVRWVATISYSLYLTHKIAFHLVERMIAPSLAGDRLLLFLSYAGVVLLLGAILHYGVERPFLMWRDRGARPRASLVGSVARPS